MAILDLILGRRFRVARFRLWY